MSDSDGEPEFRQEAGIPKIVLQMRVYTRIMEMARAAMPVETVGFLLGRARCAEAAGAESAAEEPFRAPEVWIRIDDVTAIGNERLGDLKQSLEKGQAGERDLEVVGWFYADPGIGIFSPAVSLRDMQDRLPESVGLLLLVNPSADQGAFYRWNGMHYLPANGFYEAVPRENASPMIAWNGEVRGAESWFGPLLAKLPPDGSRLEHVDRQAADGSPARGELPAEGEREATSDDKSPADDATAGEEHPMPGEEPLPGEGEPEPESSRPIYVEVITEEPVEYVPPQRPADTLDLVPGPELFPEGPEETETDLPSPDPLIPHPYGTTAPLGVFPPGREGTGAESPESRNTDQREETSAGSVLPAPSAEPEGESHDPQSATAQDSGPLAEQSVVRVSPPGIHVAYVAPGLYAVKRTMPAALIPVKHSIVQPVVKRQSAREGLMTLGSLLGIIALVAFLLGKPQRPEGTPQAGTPEGTGQGNALVSEPTATQVQVEVILPGQEQQLPGVPDGAFYVAPSPVPSRTSSVSATQVPLETVNATGVTPTQTPPGGGRRTEIAP